MNKIAIIGIGAVGKGMLHIFPDAYQYDEPKKIGKKAEVNKCDLGIICVPTPSKEDGSCDTSIVESVIKWLDTPLILIKSALEPGTGDKLAERYDKRIVVSPEYMGESKYYIPDRFLDKENPLKHEFLILGGTDTDCTDVADIFSPYVGPVTRIRFMTRTEAELVKYAENTFFATKVTFVNELREICEACGASWHRVREGWIDDPRIGPMHTAVFKNEKGFGGKCYPKDTKALVALAKKRKVNPILLNAVLEKNRTYRDA